MSKNKYKKEENKCIKYVSIGMIIRIILTFVSFIILYNYKNKLEKNIYLILPILLLVLDKFDNISICTNTFYYQINDKIVDMLSYLFLYFIIPINPFLQTLIIYRIFGIILFGYTKLSIYLILFFDFIKEYLLYMYIFNKNYIYLPLFIIGKIILEFIHHNIINKTSYDR
jgi:hypothetical protein